MGIPPERFYSLLFESLLKSDSFSLLYSKRFFMFLINSRPVGDVIRSLKEENPDSSPREIYDIIRSSYSEEWFDSVTPSLKGNDNRLFHRVRSIFSS